METVYTGTIEKRIRPRYLAHFGVHIRMPKKGGGHEVVVRTSKDLSEGGVAVYTDDLGLNQNMEYDIAIVTKMAGQDNVVNARMFKAIPRHTTRGITGFLMIRKQKPTF